ncbi:hypothetical protein HYN59_04895 [Flavobacterium album]|uniref:Uncharacterized protein n=2 Tax=Flavobacterium album TaxID=2175091 RepID=A0A2S1QVS6_9FLAO|nr:hypothetical protein HYN59_04895 [Flavobacterium album]
MISVSYCSGQVSGDYSIFSKEYSKEIALFDAKEFLFREVLKTSDKPLKFEVDPLAAASSGELTTLSYKCEEREKEGLVLGFYGTYWNEHGVIHTGFGFKHLDREKATEFLDKIQQIIDSEQKYLHDGTGTNNIVFTYDDIDILITYDVVTKIRLFWKNFDSTWERTAFERSHRRFERKKTK